MWTWTRFIPEQDVKAARARGGNLHISAVANASLEQRPIVQAAVHEFFAPEHLGFISQSEYLDEVKSITRVEGGYEVSAIIRGD